MKESYSAAKALKLHTDLTLRLVCMSSQRLIINFACHHKDCTNASGGRRLLDITNTDKDDYTFCTNLNQSECYETQGSFFL